MTIICSSYPHYGRRSRRGGAGAGQGRAAFTAKNVCAFRLSSGLLSLKRDFIFRKAADGQRGKKRRPVRSGMRSESPPTPLANGCERGCRTLRTGLFVYRLPSGTCKLLRDDFKTCPEICYRGTTLRGGTLFWKSHSPWLARTFRHLYGRESAGLTLSGGTGGVFGLLI